MYIDRMRLSGLSGIDTESMLNKIMQAERKPIYTLKQKKQQLEWKRDDYREVNKMLLELRDLARDMRYTTSFNKRSVSSTNESIIKASAAPNTMIGRYTIDVTQLASGATITSAQLPTSPINEDHSIKLNGVQIDITNGDSIDDIVKKFNAKTSQTGVQVNYDKNLNRMFFMTTKTGSDQKIEFDKSTSDATGDDLVWFKDVFLGLENPDTSSVLKEGTDAKIKFNGSDELSFKTNSITINGLTLDLKAIGSTTLDVTNDVDANFESIKKFIEKYNEVIGKLNDKISEKFNRSLLYPTDEEREKMSEKDLELWEKNAKSGMLQRDPTITSYLSQFRADFYSELTTAPDDYDTMFDIGLQTGKYQDKGKIIIDEDKLKAALASDPDKVMNLFTAYATKDVPDPKNSNKTIKVMDHDKSGIAQRLYYSLDKIINTITEKAGSQYDTEQSQLSKEIIDLTNRIKSFEKKLISIENRYVKQFSAMETAISKASSQSSWLMSQSG